MPRVAVLSQRNCRNGAALFPAYGVWAEAEDVLLSSTKADIVHIDTPIENPRIRVRRKSGRILRRAFGPQASIPALGAGRRPLAPLQGRYDLAVFLAFSIWDLPLLERLGPLHRYADQIAVWFLETWPSTYTDGRMAYEAFQAADHVFVGLDVAAEPLSETIQRPVGYLPMAADALRFCPESPEADRPIDLISVGRRRPEQHEQFLKWAQDRERNYLYDTSTPVTGSASHRDRLGRSYASAKVTTCNYAKIDRPDITGDFRAIPGRLWEGLAAGTAMVGVPPSNEAQEALFGRTVVVPTPSDPTELPDFAEDVIAAHGQEGAASHVRLALTAHDWAHRWMSLFNQIGVKTPRGLQSRINGLAYRADAFAPTTGRSDASVGPPPGGYVVPRRPARSQG